VFSTAYSVFKNIGGSTMLQLNNVIHCLFIVMVGLLLSSCLESDDLLVDKADLADPFGNEFGMTYQNSEVLIPNGKWFDSMSRNGKIFQVGFVAADFFEETARYSYWITVFRSEGRYSYAFMRFNKTERSAYVCRPTTQVIHSKKELYALISDEYRGLVKNGMQGYNCGVPSFVHEAPAVAIRHPLPEGPLSLEDKQQLLSEMESTAERGRRRDGKNVAYDFLSRGGISVECEGSFSGRIASNRGDADREAAFSLVIVYMGEPPTIAGQKEGFKACVVSLRKMEFMIKQNSAGPFAMTSLPSELPPARLIGIGRDFRVFFDSEETDHQ
jgi:hypothetical protein